MKRLRVLMEDKFNDATLINLKNTIDEFMKEGADLSKDLSVEEKYNIMKRGVSESIDRAIRAVYKDVGIGFDEAEILKKKNELEQLVQEYFDQKFSEDVAKDWDMNR
jgi:hypothetical protein